MSDLAADLARLASYGGRDLSAIAAIRPVLNWGSLRICGFELFPDGELVFLGSGNSWFVALSGWRV